MKINELPAKPDTRYPTIVKINEDYYLVSILYAPEPRSEFVRIAINIVNGEWFEWDEEPEKKFDDSIIEYFAPETRFEIILK